MATAATTTGKVHCVKCGKAEITYKCEGCSESFCLDHLTEHRQTLGKQLDEIENKRNLFRQELSEKKENPQKHSWMKQIDEWQRESIDRIRETAEEARELLAIYIPGHINRIEIDLSNLTEQLTQIRQENDYDEIILNRCIQELARLEEQLVKSSNVSIDRDSSSFISKISVIIPEVRLKLNLIELLRKYLASRPFHYKERLFEIRDSFNK